jgi:PPOX class probable F420-dependent enzyme
MEEIPDSHRDLFDRETFAHLSTKMPDGTPHVTPVWVGLDEETGHVLVNTAKGRQKERNVREDPQVGLSIPDPEDPYRYLSVRGVVDEVTEEGAVETIDAFTRRYFGEDEYPHHGEERGPRVNIRIRPERVVASG